MVDRRYAFLVLGMTAVFLLCAGCSQSFKTLPATPAAILPTFPTARAQTALAAPVAPPVAPAPRPLVLLLQWECYDVELDGSVITGIESSADLLNWQVLTNWPVFTVSNSLTITSDQPAQFYRAFNRER